MCNLYIDVYIYLCYNKANKESEHDMPITEAQKRATMKYMKNNYDRIELKVTKGKKATLQAHAAERGESLNGFVNRAIDEAVERDTKKESDNNV